MRYQTANRSVDFQWLVCVVAPTCEPHNAGAASLEMVVVASAAVFTDPYLQGSTGKLEPQLTPTFEGLC